MKKIILLVVATLAALSANASLIGLAIKSDTLVYDRDYQGVASFDVTYTPDTACSIVVNIVDAFTGKPLQEDINNIPDEIAYQPHGHALARLTDWSTSPITKDMREVDDNGSTVFTNTDPSHRYSVAATSSTYGFSSIAYFYFPSTDFVGRCNINVRLKKYPINDVNGDGVINVSDATAIINMILDPAAYDLLLGDFDLNGTINVSDVTTCINKILGE